MSRGGKRTGTPGKTYANRTDLNAPKVNFDGGYGEDTAQAPLQAARTAPATPTAAPAQVSAPSPRPVTPLDAPDDAPWQPVTAGLPMGPCPGPEALGMQSQNASLSRLAEFLPVLEIMASRPDSTQDARNFVRLVRANSVAV